MKTAQRKPNHPAPIAAPPEAVDCPLVALLRDAESLIQASHRYEEIGELSKENIEVDDALEAITHLASVRKARTIEGALFQLVLTWNRVEMIHNAETEYMREASFREVERMLWSIREAIEVVTSIAPSKTISGYYMLPSNDQAGAAIAAALAQNAVGAKNPY